MIQRKPRKAVHVETRSSTHPDLEILGQELGFASQSALRTLFTLDGTTCTASLDINSGSVVGTFFSANFAVPAPVGGPTLSMRRETNDDRADKEKGVSVEVQVGDPGFDVEVYVDSTASDAEARRFLSRPEVREAAKWLVDHGMRSVGVDATRAWADSTSRPGHFKGELPEVYECLLVLASGGPLQGPVTSAPGGLLIAAAVLIAAVGLFFLFGTLGTMEGVRWLALVPGFIGLFVGYRVPKPLIEKLVAGHSASGQRARVIAFALAIATGCFTTFLAAHLLS